MKIRNLLFYVLCGFIFFSCSQSNERKDMEMDHFVTDLLNQMTLREKLGQLNLPSGGDLVTGSVMNGELGELIRKQEIGGFFNVKGVHKIYALQRLAVEESRLKIPLLVGADVIHGYETIFPIPLALSCSWDTLAVERMARISAVEASADGISWTFSPMVDICRDSRWGRIAEGSGEDPYLGSLFAKAYVRGYQGNNMQGKDEILSCVKHFALYGASESGKDYNTVDMSRQRMYNEFLAPYRAAVEAGVGSVMSSFNLVDGIPATANKWLLTDLLRDEWGFRGLLVTDYNSIAEMSTHGVAPLKEASIRALQAGTDMDMVSCGFLNTLAESLQEGKVTEEQINTACRRVLEAKYKLGLFSDPYKYCDTLRTKDVLYADVHRAAAREIAAETFVLLKNTDNLLPLPQKGRIALIGPMADAPHDQLGTWVFDGEKTHTQTPLKALREMYGSEVRIIYEQGLAYSRDKRTDGIAKAVAAARQADVVLAFVGEEAILSGEAHSLADLDLRGAQKQLIDALSKIDKPLVTVIMAGRPLTIAEEVEKSDAVLYSFHPGTMGGPALADILFGKVVPSGKTPVTFPKMVGQLPIYYAHNHTGRAPSGKETLIDDIPLEAGQTSLGCSSFYMDAGFGPLFPFGYGLSYTTFAYDKLHLSADTLRMNEILTITANLTNTGKYAGTEVVQLYVRDKVGSVTRPVKELKGFQRIALQPGETKTVTFELPISDLAFWNIDMKKVVEPGEFTLWIGTNSSDGLSADFEVLN